MTSDQDPAANRTRTGPSATPLGALAVALVLGALVAAAAVGAYAGVPKLPGLQGFDAPTAFAAAVVSVVAIGAAVGVLGAVIAAVFLLPHSRGAHTVPAATAPWVAWGRRAAYVWLAASLVGMPLVAATAMGMPAVFAVLGLDTFLSSSQTAQLWLVQAVVAAVVSGLLAFTRSVGGLTIAAYLTVLGLLPAVVVGSVSVGGDHDLATDAAILAMIAFAVWAGLALAVLSLGPDADRGTALRRYQWLSLPAALVVLAGGAVVTWHGLAGTAPTGSIFGVAHLVGAAAGVLALITWGLRLALPLPLRRGAVVADVVLMGVGVGAWVASNLVAAPRFTAPQSIQINYLGYPVDTAPTVATLLGPGRPNVLFTVVALLALGLYWAGHLVLRRRGIAWPWSRSIWWSVGWLLVLWISTSGLWMYSGAAFSIHMGVHMAFNMFAPVFIVMGAPVTLALRVLPARGGRRTPGAREALSGVLAWRPLRVLLHPLAVWLYFVSAFYILYFSDLFDWAMRYHWAHQFMTVHFLFTGLLFYGIVIGADTPPHPLPYVGKIGFLFSAMPFHAFFAVGILSSEALLAPTFYPALAVPWRPDLLADQDLGGQITWATGELPMLIVIIALVFQWVRQDTRDATRQDRAMDSGLDDSFEAYNAMLRRLNAAHGEPVDSDDADDPDGAHRAGAEPR